MTNQLPKLHVVGSIPIARSNTWLYGLELSPVAFLTPPRKPIVNESAIF